MPANRTYKDSLFSLYLSDPQRLIEVYNAIADTDYPPDTPVQMNTLEDVLFKNQINDLSFELDNQMVVLIEHQSTVNENMALRLFLYCARVYEKILKRRALYKKKRVMLSVPRFIVLYNGKEDYPEHGEQYLSESYKVKQENPALELKVDIYNINYEKAPEIIARSKSLNDYSLFVHTVKMGVQEGRTFDEAVEDAVVYCIRNNIMKEFLELHGSEVSNMLLSEWNMDEALEVTQEEAFADGVEYGLERGIEQGLEQGMELGVAQGETAEREKNIRALRRKLSAEDIAETLEVPLDYVLKVMNHEAACTMQVREPDVEYVAVKKQ